MIFKPFCIKKEGAFRFRGELEVTSHSALADPVFAELWQGFCFRMSRMRIRPTEELIFSVGDVAPLSSEGAEYAIRIEREGFCVCAKNEKDLIRGVMTLLDCIRVEEEDGEDILALDCCEIRDSALIKTRMVHFCVFPETELWELHRFIRLSAALKYTHLIIEFWGMLRYDCMRELGWPHAYTKEEIRPLISEARALGLEVVPMFNHWGHASAGRVMHGKHVVLDQNPTLQAYFSEDGWSWNIRSARARALMRSIREELVELCGEGEYFHIGCDEAYDFDLNDEAAQDLVCDYINEVDEHLSSLGRKTVAWGDMFLYRYPHYNADNYYFCCAPSEKAADRMLARLSRRILIADWQYCAKEAPVETSSVFKNAGFSYFICPWDVGEREMKAVLKTAKEQGAYGLIHTTWHTLSRGMPYVAVAAKGCYEDEEGFCYDRIRTATAALLRKVFFADGIYEKAGFGKHQIGDYLL